MLNGKRMDELGFVIWQSGRIDTYGKRNRKEQKVLDASISHFHSFKRDIANTMLFKMLNIPIENHNNIYSLCEAMIRKNTIAFSNANTFDSNGIMIGYLFLPRTLSSQQIQTFITILPVFSDFTELHVHKHTVGQTWDLEQAELQNLDQLEKRFMPWLTDTKSKHKRSL